MFRLFACARPGRSGAVMGRRSVRYERRNVTYTDVTGAAIAAGSFLGVADPAAWTQQRS